MTFVSMATGVSGGWYLPWLSDEELVSWKESIWRPHSLDPRTAGGLSHIHTVRGCFMCCGVLSSSQFVDQDFAGLSGARVVRIATHPDFQGMGYGSRALELLRDYYEGRTTSLGEEEGEGEEGEGRGEPEEVGIHTSRDSIVSTHLMWH